MALKSAGGIKAYAGEYPVPRFRVPYKGKPSFAGDEWDNPGKHGKNRLCSKPKAFFLKNFEKSTQFLTN
jgi:hypothetical protein